MDRQTMHDPSTASHGGPQVSQASSDQRQHNTMELDWSIASTPTTQVPERFLALTLLSSPNPRPFIAQIIFTNAREPWHQGVQGAY